MTKRQRKLCSYSGCKLKAEMDNVLLDPETQEPHTSTYFCGVHWFEYVGYQIIFSAHVKRYREAVKRGVLLCKMENSEIRDIELNILESFTKK